jgi:pimeloyl-ACP methyl ester carboxylesterase
MALKDKQITVNGVNVRYWEDGPTAAAPVILLHGSVGDAAFHWERLIPEMSHSYRIFAPDLPGFGRTDPLSEMTFDALLAWLESLYEALELRQAVLIGNSVGGLLARLFSAAHPSKVPALVLINGGVLPSKPSGFLQVVAGLPFISDLLFNTMSKQGVGKREALDWVLNDESKLTDEMVQVAADSAPGLAAVMRMQIVSAVPEERVPIIPTLLLWGVKDTLSPLKAGKRVHKAIAGSTLIEIEETKQTPHIEEPEVIGFQIVAFLDNLGKPKSPNFPGAGTLGDG